MPNFFITVLAVLMAWSILNHFDLVEAKCHIVIPVIEGSEIDYSKLEK